MKKRKSMIGMIVMLMAMLLLITAGCTDTTTVNENNEPMIIDSTQYSRISSSELIDLLGDPSSKEEWTSKTSRGDFAVETWSYDISGLHHEFVLAENAVVRLTIYSQKDWSGEGEDFKYADMKNVPAQFGVVPGSNAKVKDTGFAYRISPVSDRIADFWIPSYDSSEKTFGSVKITYNVNYF